MPNKKKGFVRNSILQKALYLWVQMDLIAMRSQRFNDFRFISNELPGQLN